LVELAQPLEFGPCKDQPQSPFPFPTAPLCLENGKVSIRSGVILASNEYLDRGCAGFRPQVERNHMSKIDQLKAEIENLPSEEFTEIFRWLSEKDWERWDKEIEADSQSGRLDFLVREAQEEKDKGNLKDL
jgi:hypothetical protein